MIVVADTSPLNYLVLLGYQDLLYDLYGHVLVPRAVMVELTDAEAPPVVRAWATAPPSWLENRPVRELDPTLAPELGAGEREAISLAMERNADTLLIDERAGREEATLRQIEVAGTLAVLFRGSLRGRLEFPQAVERLKELGFRASQRLIEGMLASYGQARKVQP